MTGRLQDRVALVTGGSRGIGRAIVEALLAERWRVVLASRREDSVRSAVDALREVHGGFVDGRAADMRCEGDVQALVDWTMGRAGRLDLLVNNAGLGVFGPVDELSGDAWREVIETNLNGPFYAIRAAAPHLVAHGGWILNIASLAAKNGFAGGAAYNASKFGLLGLAEAAMLDLRHRGVRVATILPGSVDTEFGSGAGGDWKLRAEDVAQTVLDLLRYPERALPSIVELRPTHPPRKP